MSKDREPEYAADTRSEIGSGTDATKTAADISGDEDRFHEYWEMQEQEDYAADTRSEIGSGERDGEEEHPCPACRGDGMVDFLPCPDCGGDGTHLAYQ